MTMPLQLALEDVHQTLSQREADLEDLTTEMDNLTAEISTLLMEREGLELAAQRHNLVVTTPAESRPLVPVVADPAQVNQGRHNLDDLDSMSCVSAVEAVLAATEGSITPKGISEVLRAAGRTEDFRKVGSTLHYLAKSGRATNVSYGVWSGMTGGCTAVTSP